jgi:hypothetical protein
MPTAFKATYSDWKLVKTRGVVQIVFEVPLAEADDAYELLGGMPIIAKERWFGIAAIKSPEQKEAPAKPRQKLLPDAPTGGAKREKMDWRDVRPAAQAALRCDKPEFWAFLREEHGYYSASDPESAASAVRHICVVKSRAEFSTDHRKRVLWKQLDDQFQAWLAKERVGA